MGLDLSRRLVVGVASSALFDLAESDAVYRDDGVDAFRAHMRERVDEAFAPGPAFAFVKRLLGLNAVRPDDPPVEVILLSRNDAETGRRAFRSITHHALPIQRAAFLHGDAPHRFIPAFACELFLSANAGDVRRAVAAGEPAGHVRPGGAPSAGDGERADDDELRVAFDFDGVLADDASERIFKDGGLGAFQREEEGRRDEPHAPGPLQPLLSRLAAIQTIEAEAAAAHGWTPRLKTALVTARGAPAHERVVTSLEHWGLRLDQSFFLGGVEKTAVLQALRPHIFFDDQKVHLDRAAPFVPAVHIPFGVRNAAPG